jgi:hypothetical protein
VQDNVLAIISSHALAGTLDTTNTVVDLSTLVADTSTDSQNGVVVVVVVVVVVIVVVFYIPRLNCQHCTLHQKGSDQQHPWRVGYLGCVNRIFGPLPRWTTYYCLAL